MAGSSGARHGSQNCAPAEREDQHIATFLLVHGAFHGGWCWDRLTPHLIARGHIVVAPDIRLPGDNDRTADALLDGWVDLIVRHARACSEPVTLVGHSRGGILISAAAERAPDAIERLVYCAAMLVEGGETMAGMRARLGDEASASPLVILRDADGVMLRADPASAAELIYPDAPPAERARMVASLIAESRAAFHIAPHLTAGRYGSVPRAYVECLRDRAIAIGLQRRMRESQPCDPVITLDCDHAPYLSNPVALAAALEAITHSSRAQT